MIGKAARRAVAARHARGAGVDARRGHASSSTTTSRRTTDDKWARWLKARAQLAAGERKAAKATLKAAADGDDGLPVAMIDQADLLVDEGSLDEALALYDKALAKSKDHPLAVLGKSLARAESTVQANDAIDDLNVKLDKNFGPRVTAYRNLALALAEAGIEDYVHSAEDLKKATAQPSADRAAVLGAHRVGALHARRAQGGRRGARARSRGSARARPRTIPR